MARDEDEVLSQQEDIKQSCSVSEGLSEDEIVLLYNKDDESAKDSAKKSILSSQSGNGDNGNYISSRHSQTFVELSSEKKFEGQIKKRQNESYIIKVKTKHLDTTKKFRRRQIPKIPKPPKRVNDTRQQLKSQ